MSDLANLRKLLREDRLFGVLSLLTFSVPLLFSVLAYENFETIKYGVLLILAGWAGWVFLKSETKGSKFKQFSINREVYFILVLLSGITLISSLFSIDRLFSFFGTYYRFTGSFVFYLSWIGLILFFCKSLNREKYEFLVKILIFDSLIIALVGIFQSLGIGYYESTTPSGFIRAPSLLGNPNFSTMFLAGAFPLAGAMALKAKSFYSKIYYSLALFLIFVSFLMLSSRGGLLGMVAGIFVFLFLLYKFFPKKEIKKQYLLGAAIIFFVSLSLLQLTRPQSLKYTINLADENIQLRFQAWSEAAHLMLKHPVLGSGPSTFHMAFEAGRGFNMAGQNGLFDDPHNLFLQIGATIGLPFLAIFIYLIFIAFKAGYLALKEQADAMTMAGMGGLAGFLVSASFNPVSVPCFLLLAILLSGLLFEARANINVVLRRPYVNGFRLVFAGLAVFGALLILSEHIFYFAYQNYYLKNYELSLRLSKISRLLNPTNQLFFIYEAGNEIKLGFSGDSIAQKIKSMERLHPKQARTYGYSSNLYHTLFLERKRADDLKSAIESLKTSLRLDPYFSERYGQLALYYFESGDISSAEKYARYNVALKDNYLPSWILLARIYQLQGNGPKVVEALGKAYKINNEVPELRQLWFLASRGFDPKKLPIRVLVAGSTLE